MTLTDSQYIYYYEHILETTQESITAGLCAGTDQKQREEMHMMTRKDHDNYQRIAGNMLVDAGIEITDEERKQIEIVDFGLSRFKDIGLAMLIYFNSERACARELIFFPNQTISEQVHPDLDGQPGKEETFRCRKGTVYIYIPGEPTENPHCQPPRGREEYYKCQHEIVLGPCDQFTMPPNMPHWLQAGPKGAVVSEFSSPAQDETDLFTDPDVKRFTEIED